MMATEESGLLETRFESIAREISRRFDMLDASREARFGEILLGFSEIDRRLDRIEQQSEVIAKGIQRIEALVRRVQD